MTGSMQRFRFVLYLTVAALLSWTLPAPAVAVSLARISSDGAVVSWTPIVDTAGITLAIADPSGRVQHFPFAAGEPPVLPLVDADGQPLVDGTYTWELRVRVVQPESSVTSQPRAEGRRLRLGSIHTQSGNFTIAGGQLLIPEEEAADKALTEKDQLVPDDLIVDGRACIGLACTNNESFAGEALLLKQSIVRLRFDDTSTTAGFPTTNWQLRANDAGSGGADLFAIEDLTAGTAPFTVRGGAPSSSVYVAANGDLGVGTAVPSTSIHVARSSSPTIALEQTGGTPKQWRLIANGTSFTVRDQTAGADRLVVGSTIVGTVDSGDAGTGSGRPANSAFIQVLRHDTDCTALGNPGGGFKAGELCYEEDSDRLFVCEPTAGDCDTAAEWRLAGSAAGLTVREVDGNPSIASATILELDQADGFAVSSSSGAARVDWSPQPDQITLGTHTIGNYAGSSSEGGPATTATALAADPADCAAGQWAAGIAANGVAAGCTADDDTPDSDAEVPDAITVTGTVDAKDAGTGTTRPASAATIQMLRHDTDCTLLSGAFKAGEQCLEEDSSRVFVCKPTAGDCDTPSEWVAADGGTYDRLINFGYTPDEHWDSPTGTLSWTGYATYSGFITPSYSAITRSTFQVAHNDVNPKRTFRYRPATTSGSIVLRARAAITFVTTVGIMIDNGIDAGDGQGATSFYRVYLQQTALAGPMTVVEEYRINGGAVVTNIGPTVSYGEFQGIDIRCFSFGVWTNYTCAPSTFGESHESVQFTTGSPQMSWTPVRVGLYAKYSTSDWGRRAIWDWYDEAAN